MVTRSYSSVTHALISVSLTLATFAAASASAQSRNPNASARGAAGGVADSGAVRLTDTEEGFRRHWQGKAKVLFRPEEQAIDVEGMFKLGTVSYDGRWGAVAFDIRPGEGFTADSFGITVNGTDIRLGKGIGEAPAFAPVIVHYDPSHKRASVTLRGKPFDQFDVLQDDWDGRLSLTFWHNNWTGKCTVRRVVVYTGGGPGGAAAGPGLDPAGDGPQGERPADAGPGAGGPAKAEPEFAGNDAARQAKVRYDRAITAARQDYQKRLTFLRKDFEGKVLASRKAYSAALKSAASDAQRKNQSEVAAAIEAAAADLDAERPLVWPETVLPAETELAASTGAKPARGTTKIGLLVSDFTNGRDDGRWTTDGKSRLVGSGLEVLGDAKLQSEFELIAPDQIEVSYTITDRGSFFVEVWGERLKINDWDKKGRHTLTLARRGDQVAYAVDNGKPAMLFLRNGREKEATPFVMQIDHREPHSVIYHRIAVRGGQQVAAEGIQ